MGEAWEQATVRDVRLCSDSQQTKVQCNTYASQQRTQFSNIPMVDRECSLQKYKSAFAQPTPAAWIKSICPPIWPYTQTWEEDLLS